MSHLVYPTLDLFLYDLRNGLGDTSAELLQSREKFKQKLPGEVREILFARDDRFEADYIELLGQDPKVAMYEDPTKTYAGYYYPVCINDDYGLLIDCSVNDELVPQPVTCFAELKQEIQVKMLQGEQGTIGQTWMISGSLPEDSGQEAAEIAKDCYQAFTGKNKWDEDFKGQGKFMGADIFELSKYRIVMKEGTKREAAIQDIQDNQHIIIIIYPDKETSEKAAYLYSEWMKLFLYRHKILWNYGQSRVLKSQLNSYFAIIEESRSEIKESIAKGGEIASLNQKLQTLANALERYTISLKKLNLLKAAIDINLENYQKGYVRWENKAEDLITDSESNLKFFETFSNNFQEQYLAQIIIDETNMRTGMELLQAVIHATNSRVEAEKAQRDIEKASRDKNFQELLTNLGVGWAVGSFVAERQPHTNSLPENLVSVETIEYYIILLGPPVIAAIVAGFLFWLGKRLLPSGLFEKVDGKTVRSLLGKGFSLVGKLKK